MNAQPPLDLDAPRTTATALVAALGLATTVVGLALLSVAAAAILAVLLLVVAVFERAARRRAQRQR